MLPEPYESMFSAFGASLGALIDDTWPVFVIIGVGFIVFHLTKRLLRMAVDL